MIRVGLVSDTHGSFDEQLKRLFEGVSLILHAGDIGATSVLTRLSEIAPVRAVSGNNDAGPWSQEFPAARVELVDEIPVLLLHELGTPKKPMASVQFLLEAEKPKVVVSGHTHRGELVSLDDRLFINPGGAGRKRFKLLRSAAVLCVDVSKIIAKLHSLESPHLELVSELSIRR